MPDVVCNFNQTLHDMYFEIFDSGDLLRIEPIFPANNDWVRSRVSIKAGSFSGSFSADFNAWDFEQLKQDLLKLDKDFTGKASFHPLESQLTIDIIGDGLGHFGVKCIATDQPGFGVQISFNLSFDQTELSRLTNELELITNQLSEKDNIGDNSK